ncbi:MAG: phosphoribosyl-ATP diphosphatase [Spirochaetaceae bacterium]|jgi:phosphoribosyl-ATP pyrophosphohydrolase/phosphoribosyl-AMP cyclohydrolase|nr:phosphoribosyl-ATP diphosphatase [Spirochaetaceae bacterium]
MVIASIDVQDGKVVQLRQGAERVLQRDNAPELAREFDRYGEVAVIDLDAAMGTGSNRDLIKPLLRKAECRVGGGIKTPEQARELVSLGAKKIILGSAALRDPGKRGAGIDGGEFGLQIPLLEETARKIGRERVILAVDARTSPQGGSPQGGYEIVADGWKTPTGLDLLETAKAAEALAGEFLFTNVDREGTMTGIDLAPVRALREAVASRITVAGGVASLEEIEALAALNCDVQLGMALYTGTVNLAEAFVRSLKWVTDTIPVIAQAPDGQVLMTGFADREAAAETFRRGKLCFHSRSRGKLWMKGETSGNTLTLLRLRADCDRDALLATVEPAGPVCHTGSWSCFSTDRRYTGEFLQAVIAERFRNPRPGSYTATLDDELVREKVLEEAEELCTAKNREELIWEAADLFYFATALLTRAGVTVQDVLDELDRRHKK